VIAGSTIPFIVVQDKPQSEDRFKSIVFPIDFKAENKEKLQWAIYLGKYFNSKVYLFKAPVTDKGLLKKVNTNLNFAVNISYRIIWIMRSIPVINLRNLLKKQFSLHKS